MTLCSTPVLTVVAFFLIISSDLSCKCKAEVEVDSRKCIVWGPGLDARVVLPVRYFFIQVVASNGENVTESVGEKAFVVSLYSADTGVGVRVFAQLLDRHDGSYIFRYRLFQATNNIKISIMWKSEHVADSPYSLKGPVYQEKCDCPAKDRQEWLKLMGCPNTYKQIEEDLVPFSSIDADVVAKYAINRFNKAGMHSLCQYRIVNNKVYRKTYGEHVGFKMFMDNILLSVTRKVVLPDMEIFTNLGDWPLVKKNHPRDKEIPLFSWCGSDETSDIIMPTYDVTESTLEMMSRTTLDLFSVQANTGPPWAEKDPRGFWRGRDSRQERLDLVLMSRKNPKLVDAALTHMFFFPKDDAKYGELVKSISFFDFFKYKYQINIDGTVAAYRLPYLLAGDALVLKQESSYYEFFYKDLIPNFHFIPFRHDLGDLEEKLKWAKNNDEEAKKIARNGQSFVRENLEPTSIFCYHVLLFQKYAERLKSVPTSTDGFEFVAQPSGHDSLCDCHRQQKDEL